MFLFNKTSLFVLLILFSCGILFLESPILFSDTGEVRIIELNDDTINPVTAEYIVNAINDAEDAKAQCLIIKLDTPGGLLNSTRMIVKKILSSEVPIVVYIAPSGSRAGSAGVFITYASHIAAMAPSTNIGAAHPVQLNGKNNKEENFWDGVKELIKEAKEKKKEEGEEEIPLKDQEEIAPDANPMSSKILQDTVAFIKSIAQKRNRNIEWAIKSVTKSSSITETEALDLGVIEIIADNDEKLLEELDGRTITISDNTVTLRTKGAYINRKGMDFRQKLFNTLANPNIAYILMILGFYGLLYEITHPGIGMPGVVGTIFLILAFFSMQTLPTNYAGLALVILGILLFIAEAMAPGIGLLMLGGIVCLILGSLLLFESAEPFMRVSKVLVLSFSTLTGLFSVFLVRSVILSHRKKVTTGPKGLVGAKGKAKTEIKPTQQGKVFVHGELWNAFSEETIDKDDEIEVVHIEGMRLTVKKVK